MNFFQIIKKNKIYSPDHILIQCKKACYTNNQIYKNTLIIKNNFNLLKVNRGEKILILCENSSDLAMLYLANCICNFELVPLEKNLPKNYYLKFIKELSINYIVTDDEDVKETKYLRKYVKKIILLNEIFIEKKIKKIKTNFDEKNSKIICLTSGSTGDPKPIVLNYNIKKNRANQFRELYNITSKSSLIISTPLNHTLAQRVLFTSLLSCSKVNILKHFNSKEFYEIIKNENVDFFTTVPSQITQLMDFLNKKKLKINKIKNILLSSSLSTKTFKKKVSKFFKTNIFECYGMSETAMVSSYKLQFKKENDSVGKICKNVKVKILSNTNKFCKIGKTGEILVKSKYLFEKYENLKNKNFYFQNYFKTGDLGYFDKKHNLYLKGRKKNMIKSKGISVFPEDIEKVISKYTKIRNFFVSGVFDKAINDEIITIITIKNNLKKENEIIEICKKKLAMYQQPLGFFYLDKLETTNMGKIIKFKNLSKLNMSKINYSPFYFLQKNL